MSGDLSLTAKQKHEKIQEILDEYEAKSGLGNKKQPGETTEFEYYFQMGKNELTNLTSIDCGNIAYRLGQLGLHIQRLYNTEQSRSHWAQTSLNDIVAKELKNYDKFIKHETKISLIIQQNTYAEAIYRILNYAEQRALRLTFIANAIKNLSDILLAQQKIKFNMEYKNV